MARRRGFFKRSARRVGGFMRRSNRTSGGMKVTDVLIAGAIYGLGRNIVANMIPNFFTFGPVDSDNVIVGLAGWYGLKKGKGMTKALGAIALGGEAGIITSRLTAGMIPATVGAQSAYNY